MEMTVLDKCGSKKLSACEKAASLCCPICHFQSQSRSEHVQHMNSRHDAGRIYCVFCTTEVRSFHRPDALKNHVLGCDRLKMKATHPWVPPELVTFGMSHVYAEKPQLFPYTRIVTSGKHFEMAINAKKEWHHAVQNLPRRTKASTKHKAVTGPVDENSNYDYMVEDIIVDLGAYENDSKLLEQDAVVEVEPLEYRLTQVLKDSKVPLQDDDNIYKWVYVE